MKGSSNLLALQGAQQEGDNVSGAVFCGGSWGQALSGATRSHVQKQPELACPLCRGHLEGWIVVEAVRNFMNSKTRSCALGTCNFTGDFEDAFNESDDDSSEDDFLTELPLDGGLFDSEAEEALDEDINISLDFEFELSFSFRSEFPSMPWARDRSPSYAGGRSTYRSDSGTRSENRRSTRSASGSDNHERRPTATRSTSLSSRRTPNTRRSFRERRRNR
ncbi:hypothetical protein K7X08_000217 [Anisodus acutangulus]|uniref:Uncharacterized protein n=1 Tax=Anisodus acutangulus TaxID=402998 RepID=A0A9Q1M335_9SOLA|nr:hypothetical protein K7X08_000217 [Anisodus acutangulus]